MVDRIIGAFTFRSGVYAEVEGDTSFTPSAWLLVAVVAFLSQLGANANAGSLSDWLIGAVVGTLFAIGAFALACAVINWVGRSMFSADVNFEEMVRTLGLAYVWRILGFVGILALLSPGLVCLLTPVLIVAWVVGLIAWFVAAKESLDLDWGPTIVTVIIGFVIQLVVMLIGTAILTALGLTAGAAAGALTG
jgi:hypothetical protein